MTNDSGGGPHDYEMMTDEELLAIPGVGAQTMGGRDWKEHELPPMSERDRSRTLFARRLVEKAVLARLRRGVDELSIGAVDVE